MSHDEALFAAIEAGDAGAVGAALRDGADPDAGRDYEVTVDRDRRRGRETALQRAVASGCIGIVRQLLAAGADAGVADPASGRTALVMAAEAGRTAIAVALLGRGPRQPAVDGEVLRIACQRGCVELATACADAGIAVDAAALLSAAARGGSVPMLDWLAARGEPGPRSAEALHEAVHQGHRAASEWLLARGADVDAINSFAWTALHLAAYGGRAELVDLLLARGADPRRRCGQGRTAASWAREAGHEQLAARLQQAAER
jgi:ankyrin repeat protein